MKNIKTLFSTPSTALLMVFFAALSLGQLQRVQLPGDIAFYVHDVVIVLFLLWNLLTDKKIQAVFQKIPALFKKIKTTHALELAWVVWIIGGMIAGGVIGTVTLKAVLYVLRLLTYIAFIIVVKKKAQAYSSQSALAVTGLLVALWGFIQYFFIPDTRFLSIFGWDNHYYRLVSTLFDPAFTGMLLVLTFGLWQFPKALPNISAQMKKVIQLFLVAAIAATFSRASYLALMAFLLLQLVYKKINLKFLITVTAVFVATLILLPKPGGEGVNLARTSTGEARLSNAGQNLTTLKGNQWLWGRGLFNTDARQDYETPSHAQLPDSFPILLLNATGIGGTLLAFLVLLKWLPVWHKKNPLWTYLLLATLVHSLFNNTFLQPFIFLSLWLAF